MGGVPRKAPFPWFGGKAAVAAEVWARFGDVENYVEPFFGSGAVLLAAPAPARVETVNDADGFLANFWRAVKHAPREVAHHADWPVNEMDLEARHYWLITEGRGRLDAIMGSPLAYDAQVAGWWVWGLCAWIGSGWCSGVGPWSWTGDEWQDRRQLPHLSAGQGIKRQLPHLSAGQGINRQLPHLGDAGRGGFILDMMQGLAERLRDVRVACGDFARVLGPTPTWRHGMTAVFLDPPYAADQHAIAYSANDTSASARARAWAITNGEHPLLRIALCGYQGEHDMPSGWTAHTWATEGGYGNQGDARGRANAAREVIWFSPSCIAPEREASLFDMLPGDAE